jgi:hypothetical protein
MPGLDNEMDEVHQPQVGSGLNPSKGNQRGSEDSAALVRDWELLFWTFLLWGVGRLAWPMFCPVANPPFNVGIAVGFLLSGILGFAMRNLLNGKLTG